HPPLVSLLMTATPWIYTLSLHDALPISQALPLAGVGVELGEDVAGARVGDVVPQGPRPLAIPPLDAALIVQEHEHHGDVVHDPRSEEHTSELQSPDHLVCRLLLEKKNQT